MSKESIGLDAPLDNLVEARGLSDGTQGTQSKSEGIGLKQNMPEDNLFKANNDYVPKAEVIDKTGTRRTLRRCNTSYIDTTDSP